MSLVTGWNALPGELHLQILSYLDPTSIMCFAATDKANRLLAQDEWLCEQLCRGHYPLAAARKSQEEVAQRATEPWYKKIVNTSVSRKCIISRRSLDYYQLAHYNGLRPRYAEDVGIRPRRQFSKYNFGRLVLYYKKVEVFLLVNLVTRRSTEYVLPSSVLIHDIHLEEDYIYVLTVGLPFRHIFKFDMKGNLIRKLDTKRNDLEWIMANQRHIVVYARNSRRWVPYPVEMDETFPDEDAQLHIPFTALSDFDTYAMDERYFYQLDEETGVLLIYDLDNHYLVSRISMFPRHKELMRIEVVSINRHSYVFGPDKLCLMNGLDMTKVAIPGIRNDGGGPVWDSHILVDLGGWATWVGDVDEGYMYGIFCILARETGTSEMLDCGRLRGPSEPEDQHEEHSVWLLGDEKWILCVMDDRVFVWQIRR